MSTESITIGLAAVVVLGVVAQWIGRRVGFASLLLLLPAGVLAGTYGVVEPRALLGETLFPLTTLLVALLLIQSWLDLRLRGLRGDARRPVQRLVTVGALITFAGCVVSVLVIIGTGLDLAFLLGAVLVVSGPTVVGPLLEILRARRPTGVVLNWEGVVLDPLGASVGVVVLHLILANERGGVHPIVQLVSRLGVGLTVGLLAAVLLVFVLSRFLVTDNMEAAVAVAFAVAAYACAEVLLSEAGLVAALVLGVAAANQDIVPTARIMGFGETLEVLIIGVLFVLLGALVELDALIAVSGRAAVLVAVLVLIVRPVSVAVALAGTSLPWRDRALIGWISPRGIVAAATAAQFSGELTNAGINADIVPPVTFAVILGTGIVYSITTPLVGRALGVSEPEPVGVALVGHDGWVGELARGLHELGARVLVLTSHAPVQRAAGDGVHVVAVHESEQELDQVLEDTAIGQALVATEATVVGGLVIADLIEALGRRHVYRLPIHNEPLVPRLLAERWSPAPFGDGVTLNGIATRMRAGDTIEIVRGDVPPGALPMAVVHDDGSVDLVPAERSARASRTATPVGAVALVPTVTATVR